MTYILCALWVFTVAVWARLLLVSPVALSIVTTVRTGSDDANWSP